MFLNSSTKFKILKPIFTFKLKILLIKSLRWVLLIIFVYLCSTLIHFEPVIEQQLYDRYLFAVNMGEWGLYDALTPTEKMCVFLRQLRGAWCGLF